MTWLDDLLGSQLAQGGVLLPRRQVINIVGGATAVDNPGANRTDLTLGPGQPLYLPVVAFTTALPASTYSNGVLTASANGALPTQDGVALNVGDRFFYYDITPGLQIRAGIYVLNAGGSAGSKWVATRSADMNSVTGVKDSAFGPINQGTTNAGKFWQITTNDPITIDTTVFSVTTGAFGGGAGAVSSVFGRTGAVVAADADYSDSQIVNTSSAPGSRVSNALTSVFAGLLSVIIGCGVDGTLSVSSGVTTLAQDGDYSNVTVSGTGQIVTAGWRLCLNGILDLTNSPNSGIVEFAPASKNGGNASGANNATGGTAGAAGTGGNTVGSAGGTPSAGANGAVGAGAQAAAATGNGRQGGASNTSGAGGLGAGGAGGAARAGLAVSAIVNIKQILPYLFVPLAVAWTNPAGGSGSAGGGSGGGTGAVAGGGGGGGSSSGNVLYIACNQLARGASTAVSAIACVGGTGGNGGAGNVATAGGGGGGAGGGGGWIYLVVVSLSGTSASNMLDASGGAGGAGGNGNTTGVAGAGGNGGDGGRITVITASANTCSITKTGSGGAGGAGGGAGGAGGAGGTAGGNRVSL